MFTFRPADYTEAVTRSFLLFIGFDHVLVDFLVRTAIGAAAGLLTIVAGGIGIPCRATTPIRASKLKTD